MIIIDISQILNAGVFNDMKVNGTKFPTEKGIKLYTLNKIRLAKSKFKKEFGLDLVIAVDSRSWRSKYFPNYKHKRKKDRKDSEIDWVVIHGYFDNITKEIKENFRYRVLEIYGCEADDIVAILTKHTDEPVCIVGQDKDFFQLHYKRNLKQYCPIKDKFIEFNEQEIQYNLFSHSCRGDTSDGVPNILSEDDCFVKGKRQNSLRETYITSLYQLSEEGLKKELGDVTYNRLIQNRNLIDFNKIPQGIVDKVLEEYQNYSFGKNNIFNYITTHDLMNLFDVMNEF